MATLYISKQNNNMVLEPIIMKLLKNHGVLANVYKYNCTVLNKHSNKIIIEEGYKIDILDAIETNNLHNVIFGFWFELKYQLNLTCAWFELEDFKGCITQNPELIKFCNKHKIDPGKCSEY